MCFVIVNVLLLMFATSQSILAQQEPTSSRSVKFNWALVARLDPDGRDKVVNITQDALTKDFRLTVSPGDKIAMYVKPGENTYIYLYLLGSRENLELIFPISINKETLENEFTSGRATYIPGKNEWFTFDENRGTETFYLLASRDRLTRLEQLTKNYIDAREEEKDLARQRVLDEIVNVKTGTAFGTSPERPIPFIGTVGTVGAVRGAEIDIAKLAVRVEAGNFYSTTIRLKHE